VSIGTCRSGASAPSKKSSTPVSVGATNGEAVHGVFAAAREQGLGEANIAAVARLYATS